MKKVLRILLVCIMIFTMVITSAYAVPWKNSNNGKGNEIKVKDQFKEKKITKNKFSDLVGYQWAEKYINKMSKKNVIRGIGNGKFSPARASKEIETIILCLRIMDWEDDLVDDAKLPRKYKGETPDDWMTPYITMAYENGLITEDELDDFKPNNPSTRSKTAMYIVRTLGLEKEAQKYMDEVLDFKDFDAIPDEHIGYVYVVNNLGLMVGYNDNFNPNKPIRRAELAVLLSRVDDIVDTDISYTVEGEIEVVTDDFITLEIDGDDEKFKLSDDVSVYINDKEKEIEDLEVGMTAELEIENELVINIEVDEDDDEDDDDEAKIFVRYKGILKDIIRNNDDEITSVDIKIGSSATDNYELTENVDISIEGKDYELEDKYVGCTTVIVVGSDNLIYKIKVYLEETKGTLTKIIEEDEEITGIGIKNNKSKNTQVYQFADDIKIYVNNKRGDLKDTHLGNTVKLTLLGDDTVSKLEIIEP